MRSQSSVLTGKNPAKRVQTDKERGGGRKERQEMGNDTILEVRFTLNIY
jgi:hypothetical protein